MAGDWQEKAFGDCAVLVRDTVSPQDTADALYIGLEHIGEGTLSLMGHGYAGDVSSAKSQFRRGDILFGKLRPYFRKVVLAPFDGVCSTDIWVVRAQDQIDQRFLFYWMASGDFIDEATRASEGTKMPRARWDYVARICRHIPPLPEQRAIAHILGTLDDKIELNRRMNETLEAMARAIFKSWFVDFDPVRAKAEGRQPYGMDAETAALFPDSFEDSLLGKIPRSWKAGRLGDVAENPRRGVHPGEVPNDTPYIGLEHMPRKSIALASWGRSGEVASNKFEFRKGEILFGKLRPYFHKVGVAVLDGVCSTDILVIDASSEEWYGLVLGHVSSEEFVAYTDAVSTGTKMPRTNWQDMARYEIPLPDPRLAGAYARLARTVVETIRANILQSQTLAAIRDALLPKLISSEVRVPLSQLPAEVAT